MHSDAADVRRRWEQRSRAYSPAYYAYYGPDERSERVRAVVDDLVGRDGAILELGCSSGRHLTYLADHGYTTLSGIDINADAFEVMERAYPDLAAMGTFYHDTLESIVPGFETDQFDAVYSIETLQHLHPSCDWLLDDLARVTESALITAEVEPDEDDASDKRDASGPGRDRSASTDGVHETTVDGLPLYKRRWDRVVTDSAFVEVDAIECDRVTVRVFRPTG